MSNHSPSTEQSSPVNFWKQIGLGFLYALCFFGAMRLLIGNQTHNIDYAKAEQREHCGFSAHGAWGEMAENACMMGENGECEKAEGDCCQDKGECKEGECKDKHECKEGEKEEVEHGSMESDKEAEGAIKTEIKEDAKAVKKEVKKEEHQKK